MKMVQKRIYGTGESDAVEELQRRDKEEWSCGRAIRRTAGIERRMRRKKQRKKLRVRNFDRGRRRIMGKGEGPAIGIDLGTTYSCVGVWKHDCIEITTNTGEEPMISVSYKGEEKHDGDDGDVVPTSVISRPISESLKEMSKKVPNSLIKTMTNLWWLCLPPW